MTYLRERHDEVRLGKLKSELGFLRGSMYLAIGRGEPAWVKRCHRAVQEQEAKIRQLALGKPPRVTQERPEVMSIERTFISSEMKLAGFCVSTARGSADLAMNMADPRLLRLWATLPSGQTYRAEIEIDLAAFALQAREDDELAGHLRTGLAFVLTCFKREAEGSY